MQESSETSSDDLVDAGLPYPSVGVSIDFISVFILLQKCSRSAPLLFRGRALKAPRSDNEKCMGGGLSVAGGQVH